MLGATVYLSSSPIVAPALWGCLQREKITTLTIVPTLMPVVLEALRTRDPLQHLRLLSIGAGHTSAELLADLAPLLPNTTIALTYGLTEAGPRVSTNFLKGGSFDTRSIGVPLPNVEVRLAGATEPAGELLVRSRANSNRSAEELFAEGEDGTVRTGDIARLSNGALLIEGRLRRALNRGVMPFLLRWTSRMYCEGTIR